MIHLIFFISLESLIYGSKGDIHIHMTFNCLQNISKKPSGIEGNVLRFLEEHYANTFAVNRFCFH